MKTIETVALVGLGAIGTAYIARVAESLPRENIQVIAEGERAERYRARGVSLNGRRLDLPITEPSEARPADLLIFAVKFGSLRDAIEAARGALGPDTTVISLLNGISSEEIIAEAYGPERVLLSLSIGIDATRAGDDTTISTLGRIPFGEATNDPDAPTPRVRALGEFFRRVGIEAQVEPDMKLALWRKFMLNVGMNQTAAILGATYASFSSDTEARRLATDAMREAAAVARCEGVALTEADIETAHVVWQTLSPSGKCSMVQDIEARRRTEVDIFGGTVSSLGRRHSIPTPVNDLFVRLIRAKEETF